MLKNKNHALYIAAGGKKIYYRNIAASLKKVGIKKNDTLFIHSDVAAFGKIGEITDKNAFLALLLNAFKEAVGSKGTIIMPTFTYSFCKHEPYSVQKSPSTVGIFTEYFRKQKGVVRTLHPIFSAAVWGRKKNNFLKIGKDSFGNDSLFAALHRDNARIVVFGAPLKNSVTFLHYIEQKYGVPYRYLKEFNGTIIARNKKYSDICTYFVRRLDQNIELDMSRFERHVKKNKLMHEIKLGSGRILAIEATTFFNEAWKLLDKNIYSFIKNSPKIKK